MLRRIPWRYLIALGLLVFAAFVIYRANEQRIVEQRLADHGVLTQATVLDRRSIARYKGSSNTELRVRFTTAAGRTVKTDVPATGGSAQARAGSYLSIRYDRTKPQIARPEDWSLSNWGAGFAAGGIVAALGLAVLFFHRLPRRRDDA